MIRVEHRLNHQIRAGLFALLIAIALFSVPQSYGQEYEQTDGRKLIYSVYWNGCEDACLGLKDYLKRTDIQADLVIRNVERDKSRLAGFVKEARTMNADVVVTWGTSSTLGMIGTLDNGNSERYLDGIPVVFTMVSDPIRSRIIKSYEHTGRENVTGTRNRVPENININIMRKIKPHFKRLGILYNRNENNSVRKVDEISDLQQSLNFELIALEIELDDAAKPIPSSIPDRVRQLKNQEVDFIYLGSSAFLEQQMDLFTAAAVNNQLPILSPYENLVRDAQAYLSVAARDYDVGVLAGEQISKILVDGKAAGDLSVVSIDQYAYVINMRTAKKISLFPSLEFLQIAELVE